MVYRGIVRHGTIEIENAEQLPEGAEVHVEILPQETASEDLVDMLLSFAGTIKGMPSDLARNHDHYLHGRPKRND